MVEQHANPRHRQQRQVTGSKNFVVGFFPLSLDYT